MPYPARLKKSLDNLTLFVRCAMTISALAHSQLALLFLHLALAGCSSSDGESSPDATPSGTVTDCSALELSNPYEDGRATLQVTNGQRSMHLHSAKGTQTRSTKVATNISDNSQSMIIAYTRNSAYVCT